VRHIVQKSDAAHGSISRNEHIVLTTDSHDWLKRHSTDFVSTNPTVPLSEAEKKCVARIVGSARVIGLGEMTHGSHEIFRAKDRLLRHLMHNHDVTVIVLEANFAATDVLNAFVLNDRGDPKAALVETGFWSCANEETLEFVMWLAKHNASAEKKVHVYGCDVQSMDDTRRTLTRILRDSLQRRLIPEAAVEDAIQHLAALPSDWELNELVKPLFEELDQKHPNVERVAEIQRKHAEFISAAQQHARDTVKLLSGIENSLSEKLAPDDHFLLIRCSRLLNMCLETFADWRARDRYMAENVLAIGERHPGERMVLTSGNWHIARTPIGIAGTDEFVTMGSLVADRLGDKYRAIGSAFHSGRFLGVAGTDSSTNDIIVDAHIPRPDAWEYVFNEYAQGSTSPSQAFIADFRTARSSGDALSWSKSLKMNIGEARARQTYEATFIPQRPELQYDALLFVATTTPISVLPQYYSYSREKWRRP
jgi:erythromycin esterase